MPPDPLESFLVLKLLKINSAGKNTRVKKLRKLVPSAWKNFWIRREIKHFQKAYLRPFYGSKRLCI